MRKYMKIVVFTLLTVFLFTSVLTGCGQKSGDKKTESTGSTETSGSNTDSADQLFIGYVCNQMNHEWYQNICNGAEEEAKRLGVKLSIADSNMDVTTQINACENFIAQGVDVLVITPIDPKAVAPSLKKAKEKGIHVITESNVVEGADTYVGISNVEGGKKVGKWYAEYAKKNNISPKILIIGLPAYEDCRQRVQGFKEGLDEAGLEYEIVQEVDGQGDKEKSLVAATDALTAHKDVNCIFGINDNSTTGGMAAYKAAGLDESKLVAIGFGFEGKVGQEALMSGGPYKVACAMFPQFVGVGLVSASVALANGEKLPEHYETPTIAMTEELFPKYYNKNGAEYELNFDAVRELLNK